MINKKLFEAVEKGDFRAVKYILSTLGKDRGYVERIENQELTPSKKQVFKIGDQIIVF